MRRSVVVILIVLALLLGMMAGSLTLRAFENSQKTAIALEQRGYDGSLPTRMHKPFRGSEVAASAALLFVMAVIWKM